MNKLQKLIAYIFNIKTSVVHVGYNDPSKCLDYFNADKEKLDCIARAISGKYNDNCTVEVGIDSECISIRHVPNGSKKQDSLMQRTYVIRITDKEFED